MRGRSPPGALLLMHTERRLFCVLTLASSRWVTGALIASSPCPAVKRACPEGGECSGHVRRAVAASPPRIPAASDDGTGIARGPAKNAPPGPRGHLASL